MKSALVVLRNWSRTLDFPPRPLRLFDLDETLIGRAALLRDRATHFGPVRELDREFVE